MSTAFRYWGTVYGACGWLRHAQPIPGCFGAAREHYDLRAQGGQLGSLWQLQGRRIGRQNFVQMWLKFKPKTQIAVQWSFGSTYPIRFSPARRAMLPHSPPIFYLAQPPPTFGEFL
jgi:hypothetical protein